MNHDTFLDFDLLVIGGGIHGTGVAADAAGRGLSVALCEKGDLAQSTSSASTKLIHGGLRYLEQYKFKLVYEALHEREILLGIAPHLVHPLTFIFPYEPHLRPAWMIRLGLFFYDHLIRHSQLASSKKINLTNSSEGLPLKSSGKIAFTYSDCQTDDARLVILNARTAEKHQAKIFTHTLCVDARHESGLWLIACQNQNTGNTFTIRAKAVVNASGPWAEQVLQKIFHVQTEQHLQWVKGSHIVVPKFYEGDHAYILQQPDERIIFVIPYYQKFVLIGTTDVNYQDSLENVTISKEEINYLISAVSHYFQHNINEDDIVWNYAGVRALYGPRSDRPAKLSRECRLEFSSNHSQAPLLTIFGGKLTTYRIIAEQVLQQLKPYFPTMGPSWTKTNPLLGGDLKGIKFSDFVTNLTINYPWLPQDILQRYARSYGTIIHELLNDTKTIADLGRHFGAGLYEKEIHYLQTKEWAITLEDIIWRRSKLGLFLTEQEKKALGDYLDRCQP